VLINLATIVNIKRAIVNTGCPYYFTRRSRNSNTNVPLYMRRLHHSRIWRSQNSSLVIQAHVLCDIRATRQEHCRVKDEPQVDFADWPRLVETDLRQQGRELLQRCTVDIGSFSLH
jgi:hypothetical protein